MTAVLEAPGATVADPTSPTGYCKHRNHKKCPYRPGGACENGIALSDGGFYMCPCDCHAEQATPVKLKKARLAKPYTEPEWSGLKGTDSPNYSGPVEAAVAKTVAALDANKAELEAMIEGQVESMPEITKAEANREVRAAVKAAAERPAKSPKAKAPKPKAEPKPSAEPTKLGNAQKQAVRYWMAAILRDALTDDATAQALHEDLDGIDLNLVSAYLEDHWLQYIDPDKDKARREAAAAARKAK